MACLFNCFRSNKAICGFRKTTDCKFHKYTFSELEDEFQTSFTQGLSSQAAANHLHQDGPNKITPPNNNRFLKTLSYFFTGFCAILWLAGIVCILAWKPIGNPPDPTNLGLGILLFAVVFVQAGFSAFQDWTSSRVMSSIKKMMPQAAHVIRDGEDKSIPAEELVLGDVVYLTYGKKVPADVRIIESNDLKFDKSMLTGESEPVDGTVQCNEKVFHEAKNIAFMTSLITNGSGKGVVVLKGDDTLIGNITRMTTRTKNERTSLQKDISRFVWQIAGLAAITATAVIVVWAAVLNVKYKGFLDVSGMLVNVISVAVAFIPEGLPVSVTLVLLIMAKRMAKNKILVKNLTTLETLSAVNVICSDKTGTLTKNIMQVTTILAGLESIDEPLTDVSKLSDREDISIDFKNNIDKDFLLNKSKNSQVAMEPKNRTVKHTDLWLSEKQRTPAANQLLASSLLCNNAKFDANTKTLQGDATDKALMEFAMQNILGNVKENYQILTEIPFNSRNKWMMKLVKPINTEQHSQFFGEEIMENDGNVLLMKGAPEILFKKCKFFISKSGERQPINSETEKLILDTQTKWSLQGQRVLIFIKRRVPAQEELEFKNLQLLDMEKKIAEINDFDFVGMIGILDPPREDIYDVMQQCKVAGIKVFMVTGDFSLTASAIARKCGIFSTTQPNLLETVRKMEEMVPEKFKSMDLNSIKGSMLEHAGGLTHLEGEPSQNSLIPISPGLPQNRQKKKKHQMGELNSLLLNGSDLDYLSPEDWMFVTKYDEIVFARTSPEQKLKVVTEFQKYGNIVAVTGDGVNDAPSLKKANIGIAMGSGSDVAMEAAELVLLDSNFSSILVAIKNGRLIFQNLRKVIIYLLPAGSFAEIIPVLINTFLGVPQTMSSFQMIIVCILTDVFPSLAMMMERAVKNFFFLIDFLLSRLIICYIGKRPHEASSKIKR